MLAQRRQLRINGIEVARTPILLPSFSSKGFPKVKEIVETCAEVITDYALVSAYDIHYRNIDLPITFPEVIFLDSGGYESSKDIELSDVGSVPHKPLRWTDAMHKAVLDQWENDSSSIFVSYDHPRHRLLLTDQILEAKALFANYKNSGKEFLIKPESPNQRFVQIPNVVAQASSFSDFDAIGVTEKELGTSFLARMKNIAAIRRALTAAELDIPIHVFGSLDAVSTPLYFLAGADIFDGLTWLRYAYRDGLTTYSHNYGAFQYGIDEPDHLISTRVWFDNTYYLRKLQGDMRRFLNDYDFGMFAFNGAFFEASHNLLREDLGDTNGR